MTKEVAFLISTMIERDNRISKILTEVAIKSSKICRTSLTILKGFKEIQANTSKETQEEFKI